MTATEQATSLSTRLFPVEWGHPPADETARAEWIRSNIEIGHHERAIGIRVPWLSQGATPSGARCLAEMMGRRFDPLDRTTGAAARLRLLDLKARSAT